MKSEDDFNVFLESMLLQVKNGKTLVVTTMGGGEYLFTKEEEPELSAHGTCLITRKKAQVAIKMSVITSISIVEDE